MASAHIDGWIPDSKHSRFNLYRLSFCGQVLCLTHVQAHVLSDTIDGESDRCEEIEMNCFQDGKLIVAERLGHDHITVTCKCGTIRQMVYRRENMHRENGKILSGLLE